MEIASLETALLSYEAVYEEYPTGRAAEVFQKLRGDNPRHIQFILVRSNSTNESGEFTDPWGTPYKITFTSTNEFSIRSAGKNRVFEDEDDVVESFSKRSR